MASDIGFVEFIVDQLFIKPTEAGKSFIENVVEAPPCPGTKSYFLIEDQFADREWISNLIRLTVNELPEPKLKQNRNGRKARKNQNEVSTEFGIDFKDDQE